MSDTTKRMETALREGLERDIPQGLRDYCQFYDINIYAWITLLAEALASHLTREFVSVEEVVEIVNTQIVQQPSQWALGSVLLAVRALTEERP